MTLIKVFSQTFNWGTAQSCTFTHSTALSNVRVYSNIGIKENGCYYLCTGQETNNLFRHRIDLATMNPIILPEINSNSIIHYSGFVPPGKVANDNFGLTILVYSNE